MKRHSSSSFFWRIYPVWIFLLAALLIIHSCKKDNKTQSLANPAVDQARAWYESAYPAAGNTRMLITQHTNLSANGIFDFSQHIKPDWKNAATYIRLGKSVIEMPIDPASKMGAELRNITTNKAYSNQKYNRTSFLLLNDGKNYKAYIMMIMADSGYVKNDLRKLSHNTYRKHDLDFTGLVLYFTPRGKYLGGFTFKNGKLIKPVANHAVAATPTKGLTRALQLKTHTADVLSNCIDWYLVTFDNDGAVIDKVYVGTTCDDTPGDDEGAAPPLTCQDSTGVASGSGAQQSGGGDSGPTDAGFGNDTSDPGDGGMPPPPATDPCLAVPIIDTIKDPCAQVHHTDSLAQNSVSSNIYSQLIKKTYTGHEYGDEQNLTTWPPNGNIVNTPLRTDFADTTFTPNFTWVPGAYTINITHDHGDGSAPSPADVFQLIIDMNNTNFKLAGASAANYYKNNASMTIVTTAGTYVVTIADFSALQKLAAQYNNDIPLFNGQYGQYAANNNNSTEYALLKMFGSSINVFKAPPNSATFTVMTTDVNGNPITTPCP